MSVAYRIETPRFVLRRWEPDDAPLLKHAVDSSIEHLLPWMPWARYEPQSLDESCS
jgi:RimJ/RimL family protein N-acetyltransferase